MTFLPEIEYKVKHAQDVVASTFSQQVSVDEKRKDLLKFGQRTTVGTGWETLATAIGTETAETYATGDTINTIVSSSASDTGDVRLEYHTVSGGETSFDTQDLTLSGTTPVPLTTNAFRTSRLFNIGSSPLVGNIYVYEDNSGRDDDKTHLFIPAGEQQTQKASTTISGSDYWFIATLSCSVLAKTTKYAEFRLVAKPVSQSYFRPISQTVSVTDTTGTIQIDLTPLAIVPSNYDVALQVRTNTASVEVAGGFNGYLASVIS